MTMQRAAMAIALALLAGCASKPPAPYPPAPRPAPVRPPLGGSVSPTTYVAQSASIDLFVVRSSELALVRSQRREVRDLAGRLIAGHHGTAAQLSFAGRRLNLLPSASMLPQHQALYDELDSSGNFDGVYLRMQRAVHGASLRLHTDFAARGSSPTLRPIASNAEAVERSHLAMLRSVG
jgi:putative membrane protein